MEERKGKKTIIFEEILLALIPTKNQYFLPIKSTKLLTTPPKICIITFAIKYCAAMAQSVERILGKDEVTGSIPVSSSKKIPSLRTWNFFIHCESNGISSAIRLYIINTA